MTENIETAPYKLYTCAYRAFDPEMGLPIQTSNGRPKYPLAYSLTWKIPEIMPNWNLVKQYGRLGPQGFNDAYMRDLDKVGAESFHQLFGQLAAKTGKSNLVIMCFEKHVADCHRGAFAEWWLRETGEEVPELR